MLEINGKKCHQHQYPVTKITFIILLLLGTFDWVADWVVGYMLMVIFVQYLVMNGLVMDLRTKENFII